MVAVLSVLMVVALGIRTFAIISLVNSVRSIREKSRLANSVGVKPVQSETGFPICAPPDVLIILARRELKQQ